MANNSKTSQQNNPFLKITSKAQQKITNSAQLTEELNKEISVLKSELGNKTNDLNQYKTIPNSLDEIENQIIKLKGKMWEFSWLIGKRLIVIREKYLKDLGYLNISDYASEKYDFSHGTTMNIIFVAGTFTQSQTFDYGSKLYLLRPLDETKKQKYLEWMKSQNPTANEIRNLIKSEIKKPGRPKKKINLGKTKLTVNFKEMGITIKKDCEDEFLKRLEDLITEYSKRVTQ